MIKITTEPSVQYSEEYIVTYRIKFDRFWVKRTISYYTHSKNRHEQVKKYFTKMNPKALLVSIKYQ